MKQYSKKLFSIAMLLGTAALSANVAPFLQFRSQGRDTARKIVGETSFHTDLFDMESWYGTLDAVLEYDRSFRPQNITNALFGADAVKIAVPTTTTTVNNSGSANSHGRSIVVSGSEVQNRAATDWMAENFLLPRNFKSVMTFSPVVQNVIVNFDWYMGLDKWAKGLYFRFYGPIVNNRTSLDYSEAIVNPGSNTDIGVGDFTYQPGYFNNQNTQGVQVEQLFKSAGSFFVGGQLANPITTNKPYQTTTFDQTNIIFNPLQYAKMETTGHKSKTGFAELRAELGWNYLQEKYRVGFNVQAAAPTGTRPHAEFMLEPQIGNGKHWELGAGFKSLWTMWRSEDEEKHFDFIVEADITHLFKAKQTRTFDLAGQPNSRYMLAQKLTKISGVPALDTATDPSQYQFAAEYSPVANISTRKVNVSIGVQGDMSAMFTYTVRGFNWDLGYNFWGMSHEKISLSSSSTSASASSNSLPFAENTWALKGDANIAGAISNTSPLLISTIYLAATESGATIHAGTNSAAATATAPAIANPGIDSSNLAVAVTGATPSTLNVLSLADNTSATRINTSKTPVFIKASDLDLSGAAMRGYSNKVFTHFGYTWKDRDKWIPYVGAGASAEFGSHNSNGSSTSASDVNNSSSSHTSFGLSQWALWIKGGASFH